MVAHHLSLPESAASKAHLTLRPDGTPRLPDDASLAELASAVQSCRRCPLWKNATQAVFGEGPDEAQVIFVGEQPGDQEDLTGKPFVGPAGQILDEVLHEAGIERQKTYVTNAVKHFKFEPRGRRRIHSRPNTGEVRACRWWLEREISRITPKFAVALGATAAHGLLGREVPVLKMRGRILENREGLGVFLTIHPSFLLRIRDSEGRMAERRRFLADMRAVKALMEGDAAATAPGSP